MLHCLVYLLVYAIVGLIVLWVIETLVGMFAPPPAQVLLLIRVLIALLVLIAALNCFGLLDFPLPRGR
jgi:hypothetical protein